MIERFAAAPVARLATVTAEGRPHLVPVVFAVDDEVIYTAIDAKPKSTQRLRRLANIEANPHVSLLVDHYSDDWSQLWWVRADGTATVHHTGRVLAHGYGLLRAKYPRYRAVARTGAVIAVTVDQWSSWSG